MGRPKTNLAFPDDEPPKRRRIPTTPEEQERINIGLAVDMASRQLAEGTAAVPVQVHYLRLGTHEAKLQLKKLEGEIELQKARVEQIANTEKMAEMFETAIRAMVSYQGGDADSVKFEDFHNDDPPTLEILPDE